MIRKCLANTALAASMMAGTTVAAASPSGVGGWRGTYTCIQGPTALALTVSRLRDGQLAAVFRFGPLPGNPTVPTGCYVVVGTEARSGHVSLSPRGWLSRPGDRNQGPFTSSYEMVGLDGTVDPNNTTFRGHITDGTGCTGFDLTRTAVEPPIAPCGLPTWS